MKGEEREDDRVGKPLIYRVETWLMVQVNDATVGLRLVKFGI